MFYGGIIFGTISGWIYIRNAHLPLGILSDYIAQALALGMFWGRLGCFFNRCCYGKKSNLPWAISFPVNSIPYRVMGTHPIHPSQLYESFASLILYFILILIEKVEPFKGFVFWFICFWGSLVRFIVDFTRYYEPWKVKFLTINQWIAIFIMMGAIFCIVYLLKNS